MAAPNTKYWDEVCRYNVRVRAVGMEDNHDNFSQSLWSKSTLDHVEESHFPRAVQPFFDPFSTGANPKVSELNRTLTV